MKDTCANLWRWWSYGCGVVNVALMIAFALVEAFAGDGAVLSRVGEIDHETKQTTVGGAVSYGIDINRVESCPGDVVVTMRAHPKGAEGLVVRLPPQPVQATSMNPGIRSAIVTQILPPEIGPGEWTYESGVQSHCPTRMRYDSLAKFNFKVVP